ncbi:MAG: NAD(P)/FAD-dependent oxidoreductase [Bacteroidaceae bacterium]
MIEDFQLRVEPQVAAQKELLLKYICQEKKIEVDELTDIRIIKRSIDARQRQIYVNLKVRCYIDEEPKEEIFTPTDYKKVSGKKQAIIVGAGPAGLFAALQLIEHDIKPIIVERGKDVRSRKIDLANITKDQTIDPESNYSFGEGGAGAFSDGKLYTRSKKRGNTNRILDIFCQHGASTDILIDAHPHIGTDKLPRVIENIRQTIIDCGGEVHFEQCMDAFIIEDQQIKGLTTRQGLRLEGPVILATGHSARDVYRYLVEAKIAVEAKGIAVGVRLEHPAHLIDQIQYNNTNGRGKNLPAAEYSMVAQIEDRGVYSFCMCPGGVIVPAATGPEQVVVNGMSASNRGSQWSNSGMVVEVRPEDVNKSYLEDPLCMMRYQEEMEHTAWLQGGMTQRAPAQRMADFVNKRLSADLPECSYSPGVVASPMHFWLPEHVSKRLQEAFKKFGKSSRGFLTDKAIIIGVETRTSSPVRITRDKETLMHTQFSGLFPSGEGAGYAGGIVSAAIDGMRSADALYASLEK